MTEAQDDRDLVLTRLIDAPPEKIYRAWTEPALPAGWHGVFARDEASGTRVVVHEDPTPRR